MKVISKLLLLLVVLVAFVAVLPADVNAAPPEDCPENSERKSDECVEGKAEGSSTENGAGANQAPSNEESSSPSPDPSPASNEDPPVRAAQEPTPESTAPPGEQGNLQTSGACFLEVRFLGFDTGQSHIRTEVFAIPPSGTGQLIFEGESDEVLARREQGNTVSLIKTYDLSGSVGGLEPTAGGFQVRVVVHVTGEDGRTTTRQKNDRLPCVPVGEVAGPRVLGIAIEGPRALPATGVEVSDYLILASMMFILGWAFLRRGQLQAA